MIDSPIIINGLDNKAQCWTDTVDVLVHYLLDNSGLAGIIQPPSPYQYCSHEALERLTASGSAFPCLLDAPYGESTTF